MRMLLPLAVCALLAVAAHSADVALLRKVQTEESRWDSQTAIDGFVETVRDRLSAAGIETDTVDDTELSAEKLDGYGLVILPHNPGTTGPVVDALEAYVAAGGKLGLLYASNRRLLRLVGCSGARHLGSADLPRLQAVALDSDSLHGAPAAMKQASWNINEPLPAEGEQGAQIVGTWTDADGADTGLSALTIHDNGFAFAHVLLKEDPDAAMHLMLALTGHYIDDVWPRSVQQRLQRIGKVGVYSGVEALEEAVAGGGSDEARGEMARAADLRRQAMALQDAGDYAEALQRADEAAGAARDAFITMQPSRDLELRGAWIHSAYGIRGWDWDQTIKALADNGFNAIFVNMLWGAVADYPSEVLPVHPDVATKGDQIDLCLAACQKYGVELHVWKVNWNMGHHTPETVRRQFIDAGRCQKTYEGEDSSYLAPHLQENFELERDAMLEVVRKYPVAGIHFDYIRYPNANCDFSDSARAAFEEWLGRKVEDWPRDCRHGGLNDKWNQWRRGNITRLVKAVYKPAHEINPAIQVSAAVFGSWDGSPNSIAQATEEWIDNGWLDFVCPMNYTNSDASLRRLLKRQVSAVDGRIPLYAGLGAWRHEYAAATAEQIRICRELGADGFVCFSHTPSFAQDRLPRLHRGPSKTPSPKMPHHGPSLRYSVTGNVPDLSPRAFRVGQPLTVRVETAHMAQMQAFDAEFHVTRDGQATDLGKAAEVRQEIIAHVVTFVPDEPGTYRLEVVGRYRAPGARQPEDLFGRSGPLTVLAEEQVQARLARLGPPPFANSGGVKVAVWHNAYGSVPLIEALRGGGEKLDVAPLANFKPASLAACDVVILPQPRREIALFQSAEAVRAVGQYIRDGGGVFVTHAQVGIRGLKPFAPTVATGGQAISGREWQVVAEHPVTVGIPNDVLRSTFVDRISVKPGQDAVVVAATPEGEPIIALGQVGKGRYVACGLGVAIGAHDSDVAPAAAELQLVVNSVRWLAGKDK